MFIPHRESMELEIFVEAEHFNESEVGNMWLFKELGGESNKKN